jgi:hypothetical protein
MWETKQTHPKKNELWKKKTKANIIAHTWVRIQI